MLVRGASFPFPTLDVREGRGLPLLYWSWGQGFQRHTWKAWWVFLSLGVNLSHSYGAKAKRLSWGHLWRWERKTDCIGQVVQSRMLEHTMDPVDSGDWSWIYLEGALHRRAVSEVMPSVSGQGNTLALVLRGGVGTTHQLGTATPTSRDVMWGLIRGPWKPPQEH